jgi:hypothetical protein
MKRLLPILALLCIPALTGCKGFSFDASGFDAYVDGELDESSDRYSFSALNHATSGALDETSDMLSVTNAERSVSATLDPTAERFSASALDDYMDRRYGRYSSEWTVSELDRIVSKSIDVETMLRD